MFIFVCPETRTIENCESNESKHLKGGQISLSKANCLESKESNDLKGGHASLSSFIG